MIVSRRFDQHSRQDLPDGNCAPRATADATPNWPFTKSSSDGGQSQSMALPLRPAHLGVPSLSDTPAVTPKSGTREASTAPLEDDEEESPEPEEVVEGEEPSLVGAATGTTVMKVLGAPPKLPPLPPKFPPFPR